MSKENILNELMATIEKEMNNRGIDNTKIFDTKTDNTLVYDIDSSGKYETPTEILIDEHFYKKQ